jgi:hypothetical protein
VYSKSGSESHVSTCGFSLNDCFECVLKISEECSKFQVYPKPCRVLLGHEGYCLRKHINCFEWKKESYHS